MALLYPEAYLASGYSRLRSDIGGRVVENEDLVNFPTWLAPQVRVGDQDWFDVKSTTLLSCRQELESAKWHAIAERFEDAQGQRSLLREQRLISLGRN